MIPRLGDGNFNSNMKSTAEIGLENDSPSRGRKLYIMVEELYTIYQIRLENDSPSRGRKPGSKCITIQRYISV